MTSLTLSIFGLLLISSSAYGLDHFPESFVVAKMNDPKPVTLICRTNFSGNVSWKSFGDVIEEEDFGASYQQQGQNLNVFDVDYPITGEYSCWNGEEMLSSTYLLLEAKEEGKLDSLIKCWAKSYDCSFNCNWISNDYTAVRLGLGDDCREGGKSCHWVTSSNQLMNGGFQFEVAHSLSPYTEETKMLELTIEAINSDSFLRRTKRFYLRDIIQPESPQIVRCQEAGEQLNVTIDPPSSWSSPHSFFTLEHEIEYKLKDNGMTERSSSTLISKKISKLRVRSRDPLVLSNWSEWTPWKNVTYRHYLNQAFCRCS